MRSALTGPSIESSVTGLRVSFRNWYEGESARKWPRKGATRNVSTAAQTSAVSRFRTRSPHLDLVSLRVHNHALARVECYRADVGVPLLCGQLPLQPQVVQEAADEHRGARMAGPLGSVCRIPSLFPHVSPRLLVQRFAKLVPRTGSCPHTCTPPCGQSSCKARQRG
jgi:hypothetical protein